MTSSLPRRAISALTAALLLPLLAACGGGGSRNDGDPLPRDPAFDRLAARANAAPLTNVTLPGSGGATYNGRAALRMTPTGDARSLPHHGIHNLNADASFNVTFGATDRIRGELRHFTSDLTGYEVLGTIDFASSTISNSAGSTWAALPASGVLTYRQSGGVSHLRSINMGAELDLDMRGANGQILTGSLAPSRTTWTEGSLSGTLGGDIIAER